MVTLDKALDMVMELSPDQQEMLLSIVQKRRIDVRRAELADLLEEARQAWQAGELRAQSADEVVESLRKSLEDAE